MKDTKLVTASTLLIVLGYFLVLYFFSILFTQSVTIFIIATSFATIIIYSIIVFIISRLCIPHLGFKKSKLPKKLPLSLKLKIKELKLKSKNRKEYLRNTYKYLTKKYHGKRNTIIKKPKQLFETNIKNIWKRKGFIPCHTFTQLVRLFLVKSKLFKEKDIKIKHTFFNFILHQYLEVRIKKKWHKIDAWAKFIGIKFGDYGRLFK